MSIALTHQRRDTLLRTLPAVYFACLLRHPKVPLQPHQERTKYGTSEKYKQLTEATFQCLWFCSSQQRWPYTPKNNETQTQAKCPQCSQPVCDRWFWIHSLWRHADGAGRGKKLKDEGEPLQKIRKVYK